MGATQVELAAGTTTAWFPVSDAAYFVEGAVFPVNEDSSMLDIVITLYDAGGSDITGQFGTY